MSRVRPAVYVVDDDPEDDEVFGEGDYDADFTQEEADQYARDLADEMASALEDIVGTDPVMQIAVTSESIGDVLLNVRRVLGKDDACIAAERLRKAVDDGEQRALTANYLGDIDEIEAPRRRR